MYPAKRFLILGLLSLFWISCETQPPKRPNILFIMSDDHTSQAWGIYGGALSEYVKNSGIKRLASEGVTLDNMFCTNAICVPSRAAILTGNMSHKNGVYTLGDALSPDTLNIAKIMSSAGYRTAIIGKWHLKEEPTGFDYYKVLPGQGRYFDPVFKTAENWEYGWKGGKEQKGFSSDIIGDESIEWMAQQSDDQPFFLMTHFKATHEPFHYPERHATLLEDITLPEPQSLLEPYPTETGRTFRGQLLDNLTKRWLRYQAEPDKYWTDYPGMPFEIDGLDSIGIRKKSYQKFVKDFIRCGAAIDDNIEKILAALEKSGQLDNTLIIYTSDQGYFLGEHGFFDKRMMLEESARMPFVVRYPKDLPQGERNTSLLMNIDIPALILDYAQVNQPDAMQGKSFRTLLKNPETPGREYTYYRYWEHSPDRPAHFGVRSQRYKLIYYYGEPLGMKSASKEATTPTWEFYDLLEDPKESINQFNNPNYKTIIEKMHQALKTEKAYYEDHAVVVPEL
jgi:arylsulfatase A-like enzyme